MMKRESGWNNDVELEDEDRNSEPKRARNDSEDQDKYNPPLEAHFLIHSKNAGAIIGKGGSNIKTLRQKFNANINIPECGDSPERLLKITSDPSTIGSIVETIVPYYEEFKGQTSHQIEAEIRLLVHQSHAGSIIGKSGSKIKELRDATRAVIKVYRDRCPKSTERIVSFSGTPTILRKSITIVLDMVNNIPPKGQQTVYDPKDFEPEHVNEYGGYAVSSMRSDMDQDRGSWRNQQAMDRGYPSAQGDHYGRMSAHNPRGMISPAMTLMSSSQQTGSLLNQGAVGSDRHGFSANQSPSMGSYNQAQMYGNQSQGVYGQSQQQQYQQYTGAPNMSQGMQQGLPSLLTGSGGGGGNVNMGASNQNQQQTQEEILSSRVTIPRDLAGALIGKQGSKIKSIRNDSGADIKISEDDQMTDRIITIKGTSSQIQNAQYLLQHCAKEHVAINSRNAIA